MFPRRESDSSNWGGKRPGSGRKRFLTGLVRRSFVLERKQLEVIRRWQTDHALKNLSAALRSMIDQRGRDADEDV